MEGEYLSIYCVIAFLVILSNTFILLLLIKERKQRKRSHKFITSLIISDFCCGIVSIPYGVYLHYPEFRRDYAESCFAILTSIVAFRINSLLIKLATAIDRYWAVVHPIHYHLKASNMKIKGMIGCTWALSTFIALMGIPGRANSPCDYTVSYYYIICRVVIPLIFLTLTIVCLRICFALKNRKFKHKFELNATTLLLISISVALVLWIPALIVYSIFLQDQSHQGKMYGFLIPYYAHPIFNAILYGYAIRSRRMRRLLPDLAVR